MGRRGRFGGGRGGAGKAPEGPEMLDMPSDLQNVVEDTDFNTKEVYNLYTNLNQYAQQMWKQYGVDVTSPDYSNPDSLEAYRTYQKGLAALGNKVNNLKNSQEMLETSEARREAAVLAGEAYVDPRYKSSDMPFSERYTGEGIQSTLTPFADDFNTTVGGHSWNLRGGGIEYKDAKAIFDRQKGELLQRAEQMEREGNVEEARRLKLEAQAMREPVREVDKIEEWQAGRGERRQLTTKRVERVSSALSGGTNIAELENHPDISRARWTANNIFLTYKDGSVESIPITDETERRQAFMKLWGLYNGIKGYTELDPDVAQDDIETKIRDVSTMHFGNTGIDDQLQDLSTDAGIRMSEAPSEENEVNHPYFSVKKALTTTGLKDPYRSDIVISDIRFVAGRDGVPAHYDIMTYSQGPDERGRAQVKKVAANDKDYWEQLVLQNADILPDIIDPDLTRSGQQVSYEGQDPAVKIRKKSSTGVFGDQNNADDDDPVGAWFKNKK